MKLHALLFVSTFAALGCSSSNDNPSMDGTDTSGGMNDEQTATFNGLAWREIANTATLSLSISLLEEFDQSLDAAVQTLGVSDSEGTKDCINGGTLSWQTTLEPFGNGTESFVQYDFEDCEIDGATYDGLFNKKNQNSNVQSSFSSLTTRIYDLAIFAGDAISNIKGEWKDRFNSGISFTCGSGESGSSREANFEIIETDLLFDLFYVEALKLNNSDDTITVGSSSENSCDRFVVAIANDTSTIRLPFISNTSYDVTRLGEYQLTAPNDEAPGDPQTASLTVTSVDNRENTMSIQSNGTGNSVTVTIAENGSVLAFESTWNFNGEGLEN